MTLTKTLFLTIEVFIWAYLSLCVLIVSLVPANDSYAFEYTTFDWCVIGLQRLGIIFFICLIIFFITRFANAKIFDTQKVRTKLTLGLTAIPLLTGIICILKFIITKPIL